MSAAQIPEPSREEIDQFSGALMLEFGAVWCQYCQAAQGAIMSQIAQFPAIRHIKIEDGKGRRLGRTFTVKLWPTLIFIRDGVERKRLVRQFSALEIQEALTLIAGK